MELILTTLERLVGFDTVSTRSNAALIAYVEAFCRARGAVTQRLPAAPEGADQSPAETGQSGLIARFGPDEEGGILLSGHTDVVPTEGQAWRYPAFKLTQENSRLYGRGTTDMKGFLACMLAAGDTASRVVLKKPLTLVFSYDEEIGCVGLQAMRSDLVRVLRRPRLCLVGEPTAMQVALGHKGKTALNAHCTGQAAHSALAPHFVNALHLAGEFISATRKLQEWFQQQGAQDKSYAIPYTTLHVGTLAGGTALNIVPDTADLALEYRYLPDDGDDAVFARLEEAAIQTAKPFKAQWSGAEITLTRGTAYPGFSLVPTSDTVQLALNLSGQNTTTKVDFGTEAGVLTALRIPTIVCGPGSMADQGHKPDEYIELEQLQSCMLMLNRVVESLT